MKQRIAQVPSPNPVEKGRTSILTPSQLEVVRLRAQGLRKHEIAAQLWVKPTTVKTHLKKAAERLGTSGDWYSIVLAAHKAGLVSELGQQAEEMKE